MAPKNQNHDTPRIERNTERSSAAKRHAFIAWRTGFQSKRSSGSLGRPSGIRRLVRYPAAATTSKSKAVAVEAQPPASMRSPPPIVPIRMARNVAPPTSAFPETSVFGSRDSGRMAYFTGPKKADCVPMRKSAPASSHTFCVMKPAAATAMTASSHSLMSRTSLAFSNLSASWPAKAENRKNGRMRRPFRIGVHSPPSCAPESAPNVMRNTNAVLNKLSFNAPRNCVQNKGPKRLSRIN